MKTKLLLALLSLSLFSTGCSIRRIASSSAGPLGITHVHDNHSITLNLTNLPVRYLPAEFNVFYIRFQADKKNECEIIWKESFHRYENEVSNFTIFDSWTSDIKQPKDVKNKLNYFVAPDALYNPPPENYQYYKQLVNLQEGQHYIKIVYKFGDKKYEDEFEIDIGKTTKISTIPKR